MRGLLAVRSRECMFTPLPVCDCGPGNLCTVTISWHGAGDLLTILWHPLTVLLACIMLPQYSYCRHHPSPLLHVLALDASIL